MKLKYILQGVLLTLIIAIILHAITISNIDNEIIYVKEIPSITKILTSFNERIESIEDDKCSSSLNNMLDRIKSTYFSKDITIKEYYEAYNKDEKNFIKYYEDVLESCDIEYDDETYSIVLSSLNYPNSIKNRYDLRYEFKVRDTFAHNDLYKSSDEVGTYTTKLLEIQVLDNLIEEVIK